MRTKLTIINFLSDALPQILVFFLGIFKSKIFIDMLGNDQLGLYQLYGQIISYLVLLEGGVGSALLFRLYKPIAEKDNKKIDEVMSAAKTLFNLIGIAIIIVGVVISFNIGFFIKDVPFTPSYMQMAFLLYLMSQAVYYFSIPYRTMFEAEQKRYIPNLVFQTVNILKSVAEIIIVLTGNGLVEILISLIVCSLTANGLIYILFKKDHKEITFKAKKDFTMLKDVKDLFVNTIGNLLTNNIDILIISKFIGLKYVVVYTTYNYFIEAIKQFVDKITGATMSSVGDLMVNDKKKALNIFKEFNCFVFFLATAICIPLFLCINQFITIWYKGKIVATMLLASLFTIILFYQIIRIPLKVFILASGRFKEVKRFVILEIIINLSLSLLLVKPLGIVGVLVGTIIALFIADFCTKPFVILKSLFNEKCTKYYLQCFVNTFYILVQGAALYFIFPKTYSNVMMCILFGVIIGVVNLGLACIYYYKTKQFGFIERFNIFKKEEVK